MFNHFHRSSVSAMLALCLLAAGCGAAVPEADGPGAAAASDGYTSPLVEAFPTAPVTPAPSHLLVLHTNDNWGETEPCG